MAIAWAVATPKEQALARTSALVEAYSEADWRQFRTLLDDDTNFESLLLGGDAIANAAQATHDAVGQESVMVTRREAEADAAGVRVDVRIVSRQRETAYAAPTFWQFDYRTTPDGLVLDRIRLLQSEVGDSDTVRQRIVRP